MNDIKEFISFVFLLWNRFSIHNGSFNKFNKHKNDSNGYFKKKPSNKTKQASTQAK